MNRKNAAPKSGAGRLLAGGGILFLALSAVLEFFVEKHGYFPWEDLPLFYALYGFSAFVVLIVVAKYLVRPLIGRSEDYYDDK